MPGNVSETYAAALQHGLAEVPEGATLVGVVRRPTGWFRALVDENRAELGPPADLLDETKHLHERFAAQGMCDEGAHNAAWEETGFEERYLAYVKETAEARAILDSLRDRLAADEDLVLVCFEGETKRCHRRLLVDLLD
jgi:hypothetical protein